ncbi:hypothetical protein ACFQXB_01315 [Plastorhodobacter daqingensis]|uniref:Uncharacterized protein n=1 Tax=Plastorhodobacter daqingensis TaxID=1387281 RepID=A0ABW2UE13_9RHOB
MPLPVLPIAGIALRYGAVVLAAYAVSRSVRPGHLDQRNEDALDRVDEGVSLHQAPHEDQINLAARFRRVVRLGTSGPGLEIDAAGLGRIRFRKAAP